LHAAGMPAFKAWKGSVAASIISTDEGERFVQVVSEMVRGVRAARPAEQGCRRLGNLALVPFSG